MINNTYNLQNDFNINMKKCLNSFKININKIHIGRISSNILNSIMVEYHGVMTPVSYLTNSIVEKNRTLVITVFDVKMVKSIEKAIFSSNLNITPISTQNVIRITLPSLTEERRHLLIKMVRSEAEKSKISIRNMRRVFNDKIKTLLKNKVINIDSERDLQDDIQNLTNNWIKKVDFLLKEKELELLRF